jgi:hypothetical protein
MRVYLFADERFPGGPSSGAALLLATAAPSSPLERWQLSFSGPVRERPMLLFTTSRVVDATRQWRLEVFAGHSADPARQAEWEAWLRKLVARVES